MSTLKVTTVTSPDPNTDLILASGNNQSGQILISANGAGVTLKANSTVNAITINTTSWTFSNNPVFSTNTFTVGTGTYFVASGRVGIGNSSPSEKLVVDGSVVIGNGFNFSWGNSYGTLVPTLYAIGGTNAYIAQTPAGNTNAPEFFLYANGGGFSNFKKTVTFGSYNTPLQWVYHNIQMGGSYRTSFMGSSNDGHIMTNAWYDGTNWRYDPVAGSGNIAAVDYGQGSGSHYWRYAPPGAANSVITWNNGLVLTNDGNLLVSGADSPIASGVTVKGSICTTSGANRKLHLGSNTNYYWHLSTAADDFHIADASNTSMLWMKYNTGHVGVGTSSPQSKLHVKHGGSALKLETVNPPFNYINFANSTVAETAFAGFGANNLNFYLWNSSPGSMLIGTNNALAMSIDTSCRVRIPNQPAFHATSLVDGVHKYANSASAIIGYGTTNLNVGSCWNGANTFTAPVAGVYIMVMEAMYQHNGGDITFSIAVNGTTVAVSNPHQLDSGGYRPTWSQCTTSWIGNLNTSDNVRFYFQASGSNVTFMYGGGAYNRCYGYMLG